MDNFGYKEFYRRQLPHIQPPGATIFVTFRLTGSVPHEVLARWPKEHLELERILATSEQAEIDELKKAFTRRIELEAFGIMRVMIIMCATALNGRGLSIMSSIIQSKQVSSQIGASGHTVTGVNEVGQFVKLSHRSVREKKWDNLINCPTNHLHCRIRTE
jgi:hypothetical protein